MNYIPNTNNIPVNKPFVSKLAWNELDSLHKTAIMELVQTIDELRVAQGEQFDLLFYLKESRLAIKAALNNVT